MQNYKSYYTKLQTILHKTTDCTTQKRNHTTIYLHYKTLPFLQPTVQSVLKIYKSYYTKLQIILHKTTNRTTQNYKSYFAKLQIILHKTVYKSYYTKLQIVLHKNIIILQFIYTTKCYLFASYHTYIAML